MHQGSVEHIDELKRTIRYLQAEERRLNDQLDGLATMAENVVQLKAELAKRDWVSTKDRLPEDGVELLVWDSVCVDWGYSVGGKWKDVDNRMVLKVTHWMPLPPGRGEEP